jgi:hypothetical protein
MKISFKFLDKEKWSIYATLNTIIPFLAMILTKQKINLEIMVFSSIICMMEGKLIPKILFSGFLNFLVMKKDIKWIVRSLIYVISIIIIHNIKYNNSIHLLAYKYKIFVIIAIIIWMIYIFKFIFNNMKIIVKKYI